MNKLLVKITSLVSLYEAGTFLQKERLMQMMRELSALNYHLTVIHLEYRQQHNGVIYNRQKPESVSSAKARADFEIPEVDYTRKILDAVQRVLISMSIELKILTNEG